MNVVPTSVVGAVDGTDTVTVNPSAEGTTGAFVVSDDVQVGTMPAGRVTVFPDASTGVARKVPVAPIAMPTTGD